VGNRVAEEFKVGFMRLAEASRLTIELESVTPLSAQTERTRHGMLEVQYLIVITFDSYVDSLSVTLTYLPSDVTNLR
jgi:hypothetical protein